MTRKEESMKSQKRVAHSREFKLEAVKLVKSGKKPVTQIALELGVSRQQLHTWIRQAEDREGHKASDVFPGKGKRTDAEAELARLRKELAQAKEDNEILKKAAAFFAKESR
jgi:transposase-like protein